MATNKMLIDATHPEETRVVVLRNGRVEEFDYESAARKLLRGNIYLAKVTRVEPSLQAAFVDYGGNRHGFLAFNEIHPDYYQIPMADRQALLEEEAAAEAEEEAAADARAERLAGQRRAAGAPEALEEGTEPYESPDIGPAPDESGPESVEGGYPHPSTVAEASDRGGDAAINEEVADPDIAGVVEPAAEGDDTRPGAPVDAGTSPGEGPGESTNGFDTVGGVQEIAPPSGEVEAVEQTGAEDALEELPSRPRRRPRSYKIQEVIKRRQVILVQVVKEERGNKGAALTTYLSLAGRYTVLMPNTARGGGISRKITNPQDRKRLKTIAAELEVPEGMGLIIRTAGAARTRQEIKRDFEYLLRLWESVRELTLQSTAPSLVYEEGNLIKRSIRDLYNKDVEEIIVAGEQAHKEAKDFMRMLMPSHAKNVILHTDPEPLFTRYGIERQLNAMFSPYVTLKSGGYLVINQAEALVAIDVNSGKATREFSIEETALNTNVEAADEIARQLKLRDLAGLIVIDFIDMEEKRNNRAVERRLKEALRYDRARIQLGRISHFGLMEMSRQRLRAGVLEGSTSQCPHCQGTGIIRSTESVALAVLRGLEDALMAGAKASLVATTTPGVALYILNNKRHFINEMEARHGIAVAVQASDKMQGANFSIEKGHAPQMAARRPERTAVNMDWGFEGESAEAADAETASFGAEPTGETGAGRDLGGERRARDDDGREAGGRRRRRRRRGRRGDYHSSERAIEGEIPGIDGEPSDLAGETESVAAAMAPGPKPDEEPYGYEARSDSPETGDDEHGARRRRRGRRGGRRGRDRSSGLRMSPSGGEGSYEIAEPYEPEPVSSFGGELTDDTGTAHDPGAQAVRPPSETEKAPAAPSGMTPGGRSVAASAPAAPSPPRSRSRAASHATTSEPKIERVVVRPSQGDSGATPESPAAGSEPARRGWWQRKLGGE